MRRLLAALAISAASVLCAAGSSGADSSVRLRADNSACSANPDFYTLAGRIENMPSGDGGFTLQVITGNDYLPGEPIALTAVSPDGSFSVDLPGNLNDSLTAPYIEDPSDDRLYGEGVAISNADVKFSVIRLAIYAGDEYLGEVRYGTPEDDGRFFYFDADCELIGSHYRSDLDINQIYDLNIKKGWRWLYGTQVWNGPDGNVITVETKSVDGAFRFFPF